MGKTIEERVISMQFDNKQFEQNVQTTLNTLNQLKAALKMDGAQNGLGQVQSAADRFSLANVSAETDAVQTKFSALSVIGYSALNNLTNTAINAGKKIGGALVNPIIEGGKRRALNIEQARFQFMGLFHSAEKVEEGMKNAGDAVDGTAYGLDEAAKVAGQLAASQVKLGTEMTSSLRGIAGVAAMTGSSYEDIGNIFTKVAGQGRLMGDDLLRMSSRGMNAAADIGKAMGKSESEIREMVTAGKISFKDFSNAMSEAYGEHATKANETFTGSLANMRTALGRIGADVAGPSLVALRDIFNSIRPAINSVRDALQPLIGETGILNIVIRDLADRVVDFFDALVESGKIEAFGKNLEKVMEAGRGVDGTFSKLKRIFDGFLALFSILGQGVSFVVGTFANLLGVAAPVGGSLLDMAAGLGDFLVNLNETIKSTGIFNAALTLQKAILAPLKAIVEGVVGAFESLFDGLRKDDSVSKQTKDMGLLEAIFTKIADIINGVAPLFEKVGDIIASAMGALADGISESMAGFNANGLMELINGGLLAALIIGVTKLTKSATTFVKGTKSIVEGFNGILKGITGSLEAFQTAIKANTLMRIGIAMALLAGSILIISTIDSQKLAMSLGALTVMFAQLFGAMAIFQKSMVGKGTIGMIGATVAMQGMAMALLIMATALKVISTIPYKSMYDAIFGITIIMGELVAVTKILAGTKGFVKAAASMVVLSAALWVMAKALQQFAKMSWHDMIKGLTGVAGAMTILVGAVKLLNPKDLVTAAPGILILSTALLIMGKAVQQFASMSYHDIGKGLAAMAGALTEIILAIKFMPKDVGLKAVGLTILGGALKIFASVLSSLGGMSWMEIVKGLTALGGALTILTVAMTFMQSGLAGAATMVIMAAALALLTPSLMLLSTLSWKELGIMLLGLAGAFAVIGAAGALLTPVIPTLLGLGVAVALLGIGAMAAGAGMLMFSAGLGALVALGSAGIAILTQALKAAIDLIPQFATKMGEGIVALATTLATNMPALVKAMTTMIGGLVDAIGNNIPKIVETVLKTIDTLLKKLVIYIPKFTKSGMEIIIGFLKGVRDNIGEVVTVALQIVAEFIKGIGQGLPDLIDAGFKLVIDLINGIAEAIDANAEALGEASANLGIAMVEGIIKGIGGAWGRLNEYIAEKASGLPKPIKKILRIASPSKVFMEIGVNIMKGLAQGLKESSILPIETLKSVGNTLAQMYSNIFGVDIQDTVLEQFQAVNREIIDSFKQMREEANAANKDAAQAYKDAKADWKEYQNQKKLDKLQKKVDKAKDGSKAEKKAQKALAKEQKKQDKAADKARKTQLKAAEAAAKKAAEEAKKEAARLAAVKAAFEAQQKVVEGIEKELAAMTDQQTALNEELDKAKEKYEEILAYHNSIKNAFVDAAKLTAQSNARTAQQYLDSLTDTLAEAELYSENVKKLQELGLSKDAIDDIMGQGVKTASATVQYLLDGADKATIDAINQTQDRIAQVGDDLGVHLSEQYFDMGVYAAEGIVKGLESKMDDLVKAMEEVAKRLTEAFEKWMEIKSPSKRMFRDGAFSIEGARLGVLSMGKALAAAGKEVAKGLGDAFDPGDIFDPDDLNPVITPIVDLTEARKAFDNLEGMIDDQRIKAQNALTDGSEKVMLEKTGTEPQPVANETNITQNFNDRQATPQEVYNAAKFGAKGGSKK